MGKIKGRRFRYHSKLGKVNASNEKEGEKLIKSDVSEQMPLSTESNIFAGTEINLRSIVGFVNPDFDCKSESGRSKKEIKKSEQNLSKKEKILRRRQRFIQKLEVMHTEAKSKNKKKQKKKQSLVADLEPLLLSLPHVEKNEAASKPSTTKKKAVARASMKVKKRLKENLKDVKHFQRVLSDQKFVKNPAETLTQFLKQSVSAKRPDLNFDN